MVEPLDRAHRPHQGDRVAALMSTSGVFQTQRQSSDPSFGAELVNKTFSRTLETESHNRDRKFTQLLEFLTPVYLLPFVFGNKEGVSIYCILVTLVCLTGGLLPPVVAAMLPLVILPVAGILPVDQLAAEFLGPSVLAAWLLFAIAIACDETTLVARACLYALRQFALRVQPLFLSLQLLVLALSLFLPSWFVVVLGTVFIERFVAVVQPEIAAFDQKSGLRVPTSISTQNFLEDIRRQRGQCRVATGGGPRKARRVSLITDTDMASDASRSSSLVHQYKLHPELLKERAFDAQLKAQKKRRKTSFSSPERTSEGAVWACRLPTRTIRSFSSQSVQPSSILKGSSSKRKEPEYSTPPECRTATTTKTSRPKVMTPKSPQQPGSQASVHAVGPGDHGGSKTSSSESSNESRHEPAVKASVKLSDKPVVQSLVTQQTTSGPVDDMLRGSCHPVEAAPAEDVTSPSPVEESLEQQQQHQSPSALTTSTTPFSVSSRTSAWSTPPATILDVWYTVPVTKSGERSVDSYAEWASQLMSGPNSWLLLPDGEDTAATSSFARSNESTTMKTAAEDQPQLSPSTFVVRESARSVVKWDTAPPKEEMEQSGWKLLQLIQGLHAQTASEVCQLQEDAVSPANSSSERLFEDCGVLKAPGRSSASAGSSLQRRRESPASRRVSLASLDDTEMAATMNGVVPKRRRVDSARRRMAAAGLNENGTSAGRIFSASQPYLGGEVASSYLDPADELVSSCIRLQALMLAVRPALIAGTTYTAIFGNLISFNTVPARNAVLVNLGCNAVQCAVSWWSWAMVALPAALACCFICWTYAYCASLVTCDDEVEERMHADMSICARARLRSMRSPGVREVLLLYWLIGVPVTYAAYIIRNPKGYLEGPLFGLTVVGMSMMPGLTRHSYWSHRMLCWEAICARMPWNVIIMLGCVTALSRVVELSNKVYLDLRSYIWNKYRLVQTLLDQVDDQFWTRRSTKANQFILSSMAALLSEMVIGDTLGKVLTPVVVHVAVLTNSSAVFYVVPVSLAASINVMVPVSVPLLIMREYLNFHCAKMLAYGVFLKCTAVLVTIASMNTLGTIFFSSEAPSTNQVSTLGPVNATHVQTGPTL